MENQLLIRKSSIFVKEDIIGKEEFEIQNIHLTMNYYKFVSRFNVANFISFNVVDTILGSNWMKTLGMFILNGKNKILTFPYEVKKISLQDFIVDSRIGIPT